MGVVFKNKGRWDRTTQFLYTAANSNKRMLNILHKYGKRGVDILQQATPKDTGVTADSWSYEIYETNQGYKLSFNNSNNAVNGTPIVVLIQYGHGTKNGGYVKAHDFVNPVLKPLFEKLSAELWSEVSL